MNCLSAGHLNYSRGCSRRGFMDFIFTHKYLVLILHIASQWSSAMTGSLPLMIVQEFRTIISSKDKRIFKGGAPWPKQGFFTQLINSMTLLLSTKFRDPAVSTSISRAEGRISNIETQKLTFNPRCSFSRVLSRHHALLSRVPAVAGGHGDDRRHDINRS